MPCTPSLVGPSTVNVMPVGGVERDVVGVAELELQLRGALGQHAVADAHDLEPLLVALGDPDDHVVDQGPGQPVQRARDALVVGSLDLQEAVVTALDGDRCGHPVTQGALGTLHGHQVLVDRHVDPGRDRDGKPANARHARSLLRSSRGYQT